MHQTKFLVSFKSFSAIRCPLQFYRKNPLQSKELPASAASACSAWPPAEGWLGVMLLESPSKKSQKKFILASCTNKLSKVPTRTRHVDSPWYGNYMTGFILSLPAGRPPDSTGSVKSLTSTICLGSTSKLNKLNFTLV